ncbi:MAG: electron transfer flavoprotein subunit beta/FixA family protein [Candidatus Thorarchaeota archaeon]|nr:electron transfer flavoprotein subunit beta/FixA family protein [Candidatus Thorarchaeota archaeon]
MKIIVPVKQVPEVSEVKVNPDTGTLIRDGVPSILNPFDEIAVEEAVRIKERLADDTEITVITMGPPQAKDALYKALAMGADKAVLLTDRSFAGADTWATAFTLSEQIKKMEYDLVICGKQAIDGDTAQVGPELAELLGIPQICYVRHLEFDEDRKHVICHRATDEGYEVVKAKLPALITANKGLNEPRLPNIMGIMKAKKKPLEEVGAAKLGVPEDRIGLKGSPTTVRRVFPPQKRKGGIKLEGVTAKEAVQKLVEFLAEKGAI